MLDIDYALPFISFCQHIGQKLGCQYFNVMRRLIKYNPGRGGGYSIYPWVGRCGPAPHTLTLFKIDRIPIFDTLFKTFKVIP